MSLRNSLIAILLVASFPTTSASCREIAPKQKPFAQINWSDIHDSLNFDQRYGPSDGFGFTRVVYIAKLPDGTLSKSLGIILYLSADHAGNHSPEGSIIAAYEYSGTEVRLINHFRFKYTEDTIIERQWVF